MELNAQQPGSGSESSRNDARNGLPPDGLPLAPCLASLPHSVNVIVAYFELHGNVPDLVGFSNEQKSSALNPVRYEDLLFAELLPGQVQPLTACTYGFTGMAEAAQGSNGGPLGCSRHWASILKLLSSDLGMQHTVSFSVCFPGPASMQKLSRSFLAGKDDAAACFWPVALLPTPFSCIQITTSARWKQMVIKISLSLDTK